MNVHDTLRQATENDIRVDPKEYATKIGSICAVAYTRTDMASDLGKLSRKQNCVSSSTV